jgi:hypothetical protein
MGRRSGRRNNNTLPSATIAEGAAGRAEWAAFTYAHRFPSKVTCLRCFGGSAHA